MKNKFQRILALALAAALCLTACGPKESEQTGKFTAGTYTAEAQGMNGPVKVEVVFTADEISSVKIVEHSETAGISDPAIERIPAAIQEHQSLGVDAVSGATVTSKAILSAVEDCVKQAGGDVEALKTPVEQGNTDKTEETRTADVLVMGSGIAGLSAALKAAETEGLKVVVIEKQATLGGTTALAGGYLIACESNLYGDADVDDSLEAFKTYWDTRMAVSGANSGFPDQERWEYIVSRTGASVDWLSEYGVRFGADPFTFFGPYVAAAHVEGGPGLVADLSKACTDRGVEIITECKGTELLTNDKGQVIGAKAETADAVITFNATSVVLATGGISANDELVQQYSPKVAKAGTISTAASGSVGDGLLMAQSVGADTFPEFFTAIWATSVDPAFTDGGSLTTNDQLGVNAKGERFASEVAAYVDALGSDMIQDGNAPFWYIYDSADADITATLEKGVTAGVVAKGDTIEDLAAAMKVDAATLRATYDRYAQLVKDGSDADQGKPADNLVALETAPYYAVKFFPTTFGSTGGVKTDTDGRVLKADGSAIDGLYAAGEMSNRYFYNENYILAASLGLYATTGRLTGAAAAAYAAK